MLLRRFVRCTSEGITSQKALPVYEMSPVISPSPWQQCIMDLVVKVMQDAVRGWQYTEGAGSTGWEESRKRLHLPSRRLAPARHDVSVCRSWSGKSILKKALLQLFLAKAKKVDLYPSQSFTRCFSFLFLPLPLGFHLRWKNTFRFRNKSWNHS